MKSFILLLAMIFLVAAATPDPQRGTLAQASRAFDDAQLHHDGAAIDRFLAPDFVFVTRKGEAQDRAAFIASATTAGEKLEPFAITDHRIAPLGSDGGVVSGDAVVRGAQDGTAFVTRFRFADVFVRRNGRWIVVYVQVTGLPTPA